MGGGLDEAYFLSSPLPLLSLMVEHLKVLNSRAPKGPYGRAPKGPLLNSRACLRILSLGVEYLKVLNSRVPKGPYGRVPKGPLPMVEPAYASSPLGSST